MVVAPIITVFGATGFLGQRIVRRLHERGCAVRIASRHAARGLALFGTGRGQGELAVRTTYPGAILIRPAVMFAPDNTFLSIVLKLLQRLPAYPIFGSGMTKLQPVHAGDVAEAVARILQRTERDPITLECGGPRVYTYKDLVRSVAREAGLKPRLIPVPFAVWHAVARVAEFLPSPVVTRNQIELMRVDTVASAELPDLRDLGITPQALEETIRLILRRSTG